ncbi:heat shock transcription factor, Y-linked-like [Discoglossus pictus]
MADQIQMVNSTKISINSILSSISPVCDQIGMRDPDLQSMIEESAFQALTDGPIVKRSRFTFCDESIIEDNEFLSLTFPKKLWKIVESKQFNSIWWDDDGTCVVIDEELFKTEVLERRGPFRIFETDCMKSFIRQLNLYGFSKIRQNFQRSASLTEFLAEEKAATEFSKLQLYHNPNFRRDCPHLLGRMKRRVGIKNTLPVTCSLEQDFGNSNCQTGESNGNLRNSHEAGEQLSTTSKESTQKSGNEKTASQRPCSSTSRIRSNYTGSSATSTRPSEHGTINQNSKLNQLAPFHPPQHSCHNHVNTHGIDSTTTTSSTSLYHVIPPMPNNQFSHMMGLPAFQTMYPDLTAMQAHLASLLPLFNPWLSMPMIAAASAISMSRSFHHRSPSFHQCPNCNCSVGTSQSTAPAKSCSKGPDYMGFHR